MKASIDITYNDGTNNFAMIHVDLKEIEKEFQFQVENNKQYIEKAIVLINDNVYNAFDLFK